METIFVKRYLNKGELPDSLRVVTCYYKNDTWVTLAFYNEDDKAWYYVYEEDGCDECNEPESWLEELPAQKPVTENEEIEEKATKAANTFEFKSNYPYCWQSVHDGYLEGFKAAIKELTKIK